MQQLVAETCRCDLSPSVFRPLKLNVQAFPCQNLKFRFLTLLGSNTTATATKMSLQNTSLSYSKYFVIIPSCLYNTIWARCPKTGMVWTDLKLRVRLKDSL